MSEIKPLTLKWNDFEGLISEHPKNKGLSQTAPSKIKIFDTFNSYELKSLGCGVPLFF